MKPDGDTMETTEPTDAVAEPSSSQDGITEQAPSQPEEAVTDAAAAARAAPKANGKPAGADPKVNPKSVATKMQPAAKSAGASGSRPGTAVKPFGPAPAAALKKTAATAKVAPAGVVPKRPAGGVAAASSTGKNQSRGPDKRPFGPARAAAAAAPATATNGSKPTANGIPKRRPGAEAVNVARAKATVPASRAVPSAAPKAGTSTASKAPVVSVSKTARPAPGPPTSRAAFTYGATTSTVKSSTAATAKTAAPRVTAAPSTGRTAAAQPPRTAAAKKDVSRPTSAVAKKPTIATTSTTTKKPEPSKPTATLKLTPASKSSAIEKEADPKMTPSKASQPAKPPFTKKPAAPFWGKDRNRLPLGQTPPASPASKPAHSSTPKGKYSSKPMQAVPPFTATKNPGVSNTTKHAVEAQRAGRGTAAAAGRGTAAAAGRGTAAAAGRGTAAAAGRGTAAAAGRGTAAAAGRGTAAAAAVLAATQTEATEPLPQASSPRAAPAPEDDHLPSGLDQDASPEAVPLEPAQSRGASSSPPQSPVRTTSPQASPPLLEQLESNADSPTTREGTHVPVEPALAPAACPPCPSAEAVYLNQTPSTSELAAVNAFTVMVPHTNLNEDNDEEEREGSQLVSVSEMSGTTQPTEDSRPDSAGPVGGSHWRAGGALLSELDSEDVSGSQQGASELSAPGVLEGTESMDDLGDGSLKGAIDMEGASAGSPDFEKVPDIPANDFDEDDEEDDRVCDMDVGSERADKPQRLRHDNNVDGEEDDVEEAQQQQEEEEDDDEDVEMASEGVTESGLESYGNADEDDFAEDERLDNLNRGGDPPAPPLLPSAPAAQWHQPNPFADPWAEPLQPLQGLENSPQPAPLAGAAASPLGDAWQADPEAPTQAQVWPDRGSDPFDPENPGVPHCAAVVKDESGPAPLQALAPGMSLSSTLSSDTSTPEELCDNNGDGGPQPALPPQPDPHREEAEARPPSADVVQAGPASNPSSTSVTEDEASDTEGEALLDDSLESPAVAHATFDSQPPAQRCLSTVEEAAEEAEGVAGAAGFDTTPPSATSLASYGFDTMTTASNSNAQSTGEGCVKSPGIFSLEELSDETKEACPIPSPPPPPPPSVAEHNYIDCGTQQEAESAESFREEVPRPEEAPSTLQPPEESPDDPQPPYYSICEKTENSFAGFAGLPHPHRREHSAHPRSYGDIVKPHVAASALAPPKLTCADLPPRSPGQQALSPQLRRLEQHQRQLLEMQQRRDQQSRPLEEAEQERKRREEEETRRKKEEAEEEIKRNEEALARRTREDSRKEEELQELKERQQIMQWQQELQQSNQGQTAPLSPSSGLCTIYEALEASDDEEEGEGEAISEGPLTNGGTEEERGTPVKGGRRDASLSTHRSPPPPPDSPLTSSDPSQEGDSSSPESPERSAPQELDWGKKVDIVQQLINQTLLLNRDGCSSLLVLPGGAGGTLSPLESSLWPSLLPPLTPPSATVTAVSSFSPEATGSSPQGEWTVVELETHH